MKNQGNMTPPKDHDNFLVTDPNDMEIYDLPNKEFKITVLRKLNKTKSCFSEKIKKIDKPIARLRKKEDSNKYNQK